MARVNVEQKALTDPRFRILGNRLSPLNTASKSDVEQAFGLFLAIRVWEYAQERGTDTLPGTFVEGIYEGLTEAMIEADLLKPIDERLVRVKGWDDSDGGWLERHRLTSRAGGLARSAGAKRGEDGTFRPAQSSRNPAALEPPGPAVTSALTPALTPTPTQLQLHPAVASDSPTLAVPRKPRNGHTKPSSLVTPERLTEMQDQFDRLYSYYPRHTHKDEAWRAFAKLAPDLDTLRAIASSVKGRVDSGAWSPTDPERLRFIPHLASFLNQRRWMDEDAL